MDEDFAIMLMMAFWAVLAFAIYQRFWVIRRLRRKLAGTELQGLQAATALPTAPAPAKDSELRQIKERLKVLERIAVDKENALAREIEDLRAAG